MRKVIATIALAGIMVGGGMAHATTDGRWKIYTYRTSNPSARIDTVRMRACFDMEDSAFHPKTIAWDPTSGTMTLGCRSKGY